MHPSQNSNTTPLILVVDDESLFRQILCQAMQSEGYQVIEASEGQQCLFLCQQRMPNIILLDAMMPGMNGFDCCEALHTLFGDRCPPILMITGLYDQPSVDRAFTVGAIDYITKPIHWAVLRQRVARLLHMNQLSLNLQQVLDREQQLTEKLATTQQQLQKMTAICKLHGLL